MTDKPRTPIASFEAVTARYGAEFVRVDGQCHSPCRKCREEGSVPSVDDLNGFPWCCPQQWSGEWYRCPSCGYKAHRNGVYQSEDGELRCHRPVGEDGHQCGAIFELDPEAPGYFNHFGMGLLRKAEP